MKTKTEIRESLDLSDVMTGLIAGLSTFGIKYLDYSPQNFSSSFKNTMPLIKREAKKNNLEVRFNIIPHPMYGDSIKLEEEIMNATGNGLISFDSPGGGIRIKVFSNEAHYFLENLPGNNEMYYKIAKEFLRNYREEVNSKIE